MLPFIVGSFGPVYLAPYNTFIQDWSARSTPSSASIGAKYNLAIPLGFGGLLIDWGRDPHAVSTTTLYSNWLLALPKQFGGLIIPWGGRGNWMDSGGPLGTVSSNPLSTGNLQFIYTDNSTQQGTVQAYNDGVINVTQVTVNSAQFPIVQACIAVLNQSGVGAAGRPYKMDVIKNGVKLFTVRSLYWGSQWNLTDVPNYIAIDKQTQGGSSEVA